MVGLMSPAANVAEDGLVGGEAFGPVKALCQGWKVGVGGLESKGREKG
jgi:hypothetical protein